LRRLALPKSTNDWSLRTTPDKLVKIGAKVASHARYVTFQMAEALAPKSLFHETLERTHHLKPVPIGSGLCLNLLKEYELMNDRATEVCSTKAGVLMSRAFMNRLSR